VTGVLGHASITVNELLDLRVGDVIRLDTTPQTRLPLLIAGSPKATARLGRVGRHRAMELTSLES
jgi:flagellar motor switch protein FliM